MRLPWIPVFRGWWTGGGPLKCIAIVFLIHRAWHEKRGTSALDVRDGKFWIIVLLKELSFGHPSFSLTAVSSTSDVPGGVLSIGSAAVRW